MWSSNICKFYEDFTIYCYVKHPFLILMYTMRYKMEASLWGNGQGVENTSINYLWVNNSVVFNLVVPLIFLGKQDDEFFIDLTGINWIALILTTRKITSYPKSSNNNNKKGKKNDVAYQFICCMGE